MEGVPFYLIDLESAHSLTIKPAILSSLPRSRKESSKVRARHGSCHSDGFNLRFVRKPPRLTSPELNSPRKGNLAAVQRRQPLKKTPLA